MLDHTLAITHQNLSLTLIFTLIFTFDNTLPAIARNHKVIEINSKTASWRYAISLAYECFRPDWLWRCDRVAEPYTGWHVHPHQPANRLEAPPPPITFGSPQHKRSYRPSGLFETVVKSTRVRFLNPQQIFIFLSAPIPFICINPMNLWIFQHVIIYYWVERKLMLYFFLFKII